MKIAALDGGDIHVWRVRLDPEPEVVEALERTLSDDERGRANRFHFARDRRRFIVARGALRSLLARYIGGEPEDVRFAYGERGKPRMADAECPAFNVSHSGELALIAIAAAGAIGVDVEAVRDIEDRDAVAARFFSPREYACIRALPERVRTQSFFACWTRKEAFVKALGDGLSRPLDSFDVTCAPGDAPRLSIAGDPAVTEKWMLTALAPGPGFEAALVADGRDRAVSCRTWSTEVASYVTSGFSRTR